MTREQVQGLTGVATVNPSGAPTLSACSVPDTRGWTQTTGVLR